MLGSLLGGGVGPAILPHYELTVISRFSAKAGSRNMLAGHPSILCVGDGTGCLGFQCSDLQGPSTSELCPLGSVEEDAVQVKTALPVRKLQSIWGSWTPVDPLVSCAGHCYQVVAALQAFPDLS